MSKPSLRFAVLLLILSNLLFIPLSPVATLANIQSSDQARTTHLHGLAAQPEAGCFIRYFEDGQVFCREATAEEARQILNRDPNIPLRQINNIRPGRFAAQENGLNIILNGTPQLDNFPQAREAFDRAAATWMAIIQTPITIVIDVDFGPTRFGEPFRPGVLGSTSSQVVGANNIYSDVRASLIDGASSAEEIQLYNSLPAANLPTDIGNTTAVASPSALFRALGALDPVADPDAERSDLGPPPTIGFNSNVPFDFDPSDGIDSDKLDFDATAVHEIGHALGFTSLVGFRELDPSSRVSVSIWDLFRFRAGTTANTFGSAQRILSSGGRQLFFAGGPELELSTGRIDSTGGDRNQASHWKANEILGTYIGIMDPTGAEGERDIITENDLIALDAMGYRVGAIRNPGTDGTPVIRRLSAKLEGDTITLTGTVTDIEGDITQAQARLLSGTGQVLSQLPPFAVEAGSSTSLDFNVGITNVSNFPTAMRASLSFIDSTGKTSSSLAADFSRADPGGPTVSSASIGSSKTKIKGKSLEGSVQLEINGLIVATVSNGSNKKLVIKAKLNTLNLRPGFNRLRVRNGTLWSNILLVQQ